MLPNSLVLSEWLGQENLNYNICLQEQPFEYAVIDNFFTPTIFKSLQEIFTKIEGKYFTQHPNNVYQFG